MKLYHKAFLFRHKWIQPYLQKVLGGIDAVTFLAALALIGGVVYEHGFIISEGAEADLYCIGPYGAFSWFRPRCISGWRIGKR